MCLPRRIALVSLSPVYVETPQRAVPSLSLPQDSRTSPGGGLGPASSSLHRNNPSPDQTARPLAKRQMLERRDLLQKLRGVAPGLLSPYKEISYQSCCFVLAFAERQRRELLPALD